jgi:osmotically-inducible protein OsmY
MWYNFVKFLGRKQIMHYKVRVLFITCLTSILFTGCASYFYSQVPEPFTTNAETQDIDNRAYSEKIQKMVDKKFPKADIKIVADHFNVLVAGQVESQKTKDDVVALVKAGKNIRDVYDYTTITAKPSYNGSSSIESDVKERLNQEPDLADARISVTYIDSVVYLMGTNIGDMTHLARAIKGIYAMEGVKKVVNLVKPGKLDYYSGR